MPSSQIDRLAAWSGAAAIILFFAGFIVAGFVPPLSPAMSVAEVSQFYRIHGLDIRIGMLLILISGMFMAPFVGLISHLLRQIDGLSPTIIYGQLVAGTANSMFFFMPAVIFAAAAFRPDRPPELTYAMNDLAWICAVLPWPPAFVQSCLIAVAILSDRASSPIFPRWLGFANIWIAICYIPGGLLIFFTTGPFAWSGIFVFWLAGSVFVIWFVIMVVTALAALRTKQATSGRVWSL